MRKISIIILIFLTTKSFSQIQDEEDIIKYKDLGYQYELTYEYKPRFGEIDFSTKFLSEEFEFNNDGQIVKYQKFYESKHAKEFEEVKRYSYNDNNLAKIVIYNMDGTIKSIAKYKYSNGNNIERLFYSADGNLLRTVKYKFNKDGKCIEYSTFDNKDVFQGKHKSKYNSKNELIESIYFDNKNEIISYSKWTKSDSLNKYEKFDKNNMLEIKSIEKLNNKGLVIEQRYFYKSKIPTTTIFEYDENDLVIKKTDYGTNGEPERYEIIVRKK